MLYTIRFEVGGRVHYLKTDSCLTALLTHQALILDSCNQNALVIVFQGPKEIRHTEIKDGKATEHVF